MYKLDIMYKLPSNPDLLLVARALVADALNQRTVVLQTCLHSPDRASCERVAEIAFRVKISSIPGARFILCFEYSGKAYPLFDLTPEESIDPKLDRVFNHLMPNTVSPLGISLNMEGIWAERFHIDNPNGFSRDYFAYYYDFGDIVKVLVERIINNAEPSLSLSIILNHYPYPRYFWRAIPFLVERGLNINFKHNNEIPLLNCAVYRNNDDVDVELLTFLIDRGADVNAKDNYGTTPLHNAVNAGDADVVRLLIDRGADVNAKDNSGETPLHKAAWSGDADVVRLLIDRGADVNAKDNSGETPLHKAAYGGNVDVVRLLIDRGADVNAKTNDGTTPLHNAAWSGEADVVRLLIDRGADVNAKTNDGTTPLHKAAWSGDADVVRLLIDRGADVNAKVQSGDYIGKTALNLAEMEGKTDCIKILR